MNRRRLSAACIAVSLASAVGGCADKDPETQYYYDPYTGDAFPNRRQKLVIPPAGMGVVSDSRSDTLSFIDLATGERFATYPVGRDPVTIDGPHHVVADLTRGAFYVALSYPVLAGTVGPHATHGSSLVPGYAQKLSLEDLSVLGQVRVDPNPGDIVLSEDGKRLVVSHFDLQRALDNPGDLDAARATLAVIDPDAMLPSGSPDPIRIPLCVAAHGITLSRPDGARAYASCYGEDALAIADLDDPGAEVKRIPVGPDASIGNPTYGPYAAVMSPDGKTIAVSNTTSKDVRFFDVESETFDLTRTIKTQGAPYFVGWTPDSKRIYVPTQQPDALIFIDVSQGNVELDFRAFSGECGKPHQAELHEGSGVFVVCEGDQLTPGDVVMLDPMTLDTSAKTKVGVYPDAIIRIFGGAQ
jgi:DNA-binding beta-propeller fold protein YncE